MIPANSSYYSLYKAAIFIIALLCSCSNGNKSDDRGTVAENVSRTELEVVVSFPSAKNKYLWNEPLDLLVSLCNNTSKPVNVVPMMGQVGDFLLLNIRDDLGGTLPYVAPHYRIDYPEEKPLLPSCCMRELYHLDSLYSFNTPGEYRIEPIYSSNIVNRGKSKILIEGVSVRFELICENDKCAGKRSNFYDTEKHRAKGLRHWW